MATNNRQFQVNSETLVTIKIGTSSRQQLGLTIGPITIIPRFSHFDVNVDDFGPDIPVEVLYNLADCRIKFTLVHYDRAVLEACLAQSMGGAATDGTMVTAGTPMGGGVAFGTAGNNYISMNLQPGSSVFGQPWNFPSCYLAETPVEIPLGTEKSLVVCNFRAIPYIPYTSSQNSQGNTTSELLSAGAILWSHTLAT